MNFSTKLKSLILIGFKFRLMKIQLKSQNFRKKSYPWSSQNFRLRWINHGAKRAFFECFFKKTIYKVKIINLKKFRLYKVSWKVATCVRKKFIRKFWSGKKFPIKTKKIEKVQICQNAPTPLKLLGPLLPPVWFVSYGEF